jgi:hypothetical protein
MARIMHMTISQARAAPMGAGLFPAGPEPSAAKIAIRFGPQTLQNYHLLIFFYCEPLLLLLRAGRAVCCGE